MGGFLVPLFSLASLASCDIHLWVLSGWEKTLFSTLIFHLCRGQSEYLISIPYQKMNPDFERGFINYSGNLLSLWILLLFHFHSHFLIIHCLHWSKPLVSFFISLYWPSLVHSSVHLFNQLSTRDVKLRHISAFGELIVWWRWGAITKFIVFYFIVTTFYYSCSCLLHLYRRFTEGVLGAQKRGV